MDKKWFRAGIMKRAPYHLGWQKSLPVSVRRARALASRPKNWSLDRRYRSAGQALTALANVTKDPMTKKLARADAKYFFNKLK